MKKGRRAIEGSGGNTSSDSPSTPDYDLNLQENALSDETSPSVDFKAIPIKSKQRAGWTDEPVRSASSGKYVPKSCIVYFIFHFNWNQNSICLFFPCFSFFFQSETETNPHKVKCKLLNRNIRSRFDRLYSIFFVAFCRERFNTVLSTSPRSDDIPELPDLEDIIDETALDEANDAQAVVANRVETYKELNSELLKYSEFSSSENIDLSKLMQCLQDESILTDHDVPLSKEQLFSEVASLIYAHKESAEDNPKSPE